MDTLVTVLFLCFGIFWLVKAYEIEAGYVSRVASSVNFTGPFLFPMIIGYIIIVSALVNLYRSLRSPAQADADVPAAERRADALRVLGLLVAATAYVLLLKPLGFIPMTIALILVSLLLFGARNKLVIALVSVGAPVILWFLFKVLIKVQLP